MATLSHRRLLELLDELRAAAAERHADEQRIAADRDRLRKEADERRVKRRRDLGEAHDAEREALDADFDGRRKMLTASYEADRDRTQNEYRARRTKAEVTLSKATAAAEKLRKEKSWEVLTLFDTSRHKPPRKLAAAQARLESLRADLLAIGADAVQVARSRGLADADFVLPEEEPADGGPANAGDAAESPADDATCEAAERSATEAVESAREAAQAIYDDRLALAHEGPIPAGAFVGVLSVALPIAGSAFGWLAWQPYAIGIGAGSVVAFTAYQLTGPTVRRRAKSGFDQALERLDAAAHALHRAKRLAVARSERELAELEAKRDAEVGAVNDEADDLINQAKSKSDAELADISKAFPAMLGDKRQTKEGAIAELEAEQAEAVAEVTRRGDERVARIEADHASDLKTIDEDAEAAWQAMFTRWLTRFDDVRAELRDMRAACQRLFPDFATTDYADPARAGEDASAWRPPGEPPAAIAMGELAIDLAEIEHGVAEDERLHPPETRLTAPALMTLAETPTLLVTAEGGARRRATELLRAMMLRTITAMPPGKVRFTILDPVGLGENFQAFMHLADADEQLIAGRIWSESRDIDEQLARLTNHMEVVLQKYLRSEYETIHEYNAQAGEVAEPFQVLVAAGFPVNFTEAAAKRLVSLVTGGPRCGVYTLLGVDTAARMPTDFRLDELKAHAAWLDWRTQPESKAAESSADGAEPRFVWNGPQVSDLPFTPAAEPSADRMIEVLRRAGQAAKMAVRVEVPFHVVEPEPEARWTQHCDEELSVPIGRAGAKRLQHVRLGKGTSQHLLVAGKTGSGKSTFLHALVTSAAMHFGPDEVEFYLVDFKKGVEFKSYATHRLPHARVIAIESEREFGLSVLERLDEELRVRGERFRDAGVQNLADYRAKRPDEKTPRVLLIIDEFQELFVEDDRLAQEASLLMDRLVRQGRAFGLHVVLGTQTLAGAYSIARSTLGQIAVRVALECGEADAHLILSDERNTAARFLSRPGEAIYNAQNGLVTANEPFQVVWLPDRQRAGKLDALDEFRHRRELPAPQTIVFEGNAPADPEKNEALTALIGGEAAPLPAGRPTPAWLGAAVAIKPPTAVEFGPHPGANLLVVGPQEGAALGMLTTAVVSLAAVSSGDSPGRPTPRFVVLDGSRPGEEGEGVWQSVADAIAADCRVVDATGLAAAIAELADEVTAREASAEAGDAATTPGPIYLVLHNGGRFRELRRRDDDFGFSLSSEGPKRPDQQFADLLKNGPTHGVHTLVWCDSYNSVTRLLDRQLIREFAYRVALQMSAADSSNLLDSPAASDLKMHRALFYNDETGQAEKFRPYGPPTAEWLERVAAAATTQA